MPMRRVFLIAIAAFAAACGDLSPSDDDGGGPDAGDSGLDVHWHAVGVDGPVGDVTVEELRLWLSDLRVVGDAAPGDDRTYLAYAELQLDGGDEPEQHFPDAPPGRYSSLDFALRGPVDGEDAWRLLGTVLIDGTTYTLDIADSATTTFTLPLDLMLLAGQARIIHVEVDVAAVISGVDWSVMPRDGDRVEISDDDPEFAPFRARLVSSITISGIE